MPMSHLCCCSRHCPSRCARFWEAGSPRISGESMAGDRATKYMQPIVRASQEVRASAHPARMTSTESWAVRAKASVRSSPVRPSRQTPSGPNGNRPTRSSATSARRVRREPAAQAIVLGAGSPRSNSAEGFTVSPALGIGFSAGSPLAPDRHERRAGPTKDWRRRSPSPRGIPPCRTCPTRGRCRTACSRRTGRCVRSARH